MSKVNLTETRRWSFEILRTEADESWPESRPQPYSRTGVTYRPIRVVLTFGRVARAASPTFQYNDGLVRLDNSTITGPRYVKAGPVGAIVSESLYGSVVNEPWFLSLVSVCRARIAEVVG